jgi:hypothetical protein
MTSKHRLAIVGLSMALAPHLRSLEELDRRVAIAACYTPSAAHRLRRPPPLAARPTRACLSSTGEMRENLELRAGQQGEGWGESGCRRSMASGRIASLESVCRPGFFLPSPASRGRRQ